VLEAPPPWLFWRDLTYDRLLGLGVVPGQALAELVDELIEMRPLYDAIVRFILEGQKGDRRFPPPIDGKAYEGPALPEEARDDPSVGLWHPAFRRWVDEVLRDVNPIIPSVIDAFPDRNLTNRTAASLLADISSVSRTLSGPLLTLTLKELAVVSPPAQPLDRLTPEEKLSRLEQHLWSRFRPSALEPLSPDDRREAFPVEELGRMLHQKYPDYLGELFARKRGAADSAIMRFQAKFAPVVYRIASRIQETYPPASGMEWMELYELGSAFLTKAIVRYAGPRGLYRQSTLERYAQPFVQQGLKRMALQRRMVPINEDFYSKLPKVEKVRKETKRTRIKALLEDGYYALLTDKIGQPIGSFDQVTDMLLALSDAEVSLTARARSEHFQAKGSSASPLMAAYVSSAEIQEVVRDLLERSQVLLDELGETVGIGIRRLKDIYQTRISSSTDKPMFTGTPDGFETAEFMKAVVEQPTLSQLTPADVHPQADVRRARVRVLTVAELLADGAGGGVGGGGRVGQMTQPNVMEQFFSDQAVWDLIKQLPAEEAALYCRRHGLRRLPDGSVASRPSVPSISSLASEYQVLPSAMTRTLDKLEGKLMALREWKLDLMGGGGGPGSDQPLDALKGTSGAFQDGYHIMRTELIRKYPHTSTPTPTQQGEGDADGDADAGRDEERSVDLAGLRLRGENRGSVVVGGGDRRRQ